ncbi:hypothetical protein [Streptomyces sp. NPDC004976]
MTTQPYTSADLRTEAAHQHAGFTVVPDLADVGEAMDARSNTPHDGPTWHHLDEPAFDTAQQQVHDLITGAANLSQWAVSLGADGLQPSTHTVDLIDNDGCRARVHFAFRAGTPETEQHTLTAAFMTRAQQPPTDQADLRDRIADALTAEHHRRAEARIVASPEEHCAAMADAVLAVLPEPTDRAASDLEIARTTNQRLNREKQRLESELAAYRRAVSQWEISERGTYIPHASLRAIGLASGKDILGSVRHLKHFERVEQAEAEVERLRAGRAAVLREAAQRLYTGLFPAVYNDLGQKAAEGVNRAVSELRRMADETATETPQPARCVCGHPEERHFEDVCQTCECGDYLEPRDAAEVIDRWRQAALKARADRAVVLREAADRFAAFDLHAEAAALRRMADETATETPADRFVHPCNAATMHRLGNLATAHGPHLWVMQPDMESVRCPGTRQPAAGVRQDGAQP